MVRSGSGDGAPGRRQGIGGLDLRIGCSPQLTEGVADRRSGAFEMRFAGCGIRKGFEVP